MRFGPIVREDREGREIILRSAEEEDAAELIRYLKTIAEESRFLTNEPEEVNLTEEAERAFLASKRDAERELMLIARDRETGRHIGNCSFLSVGGKKRVLHRCGVGIALYRDFCGRGIGRIMLETVLGAAKEAGYEQAELEVVTENNRAVRLYETLGFKICGTLPRNMKYADGTYADVYWMAKEL